MLLMCSSYSLMIKQHYKVLLIKNRIKYFTCAIVSKHQNVDLLSCCTFLKNNKRLRHNDLKSTLK